MRATMLIAGTLFLVACSSDPHAIGPTGPNTAGLVPSTTTSGADSVNVRDFGARGDGVTDDTKAFQSALAAIGAAGGVLFIPAGDYVLEAQTMGALQLTRRSNVTIAGGGMNSSRIRLAPVTYIGAVHVILINRSSGITVRDLTIDGSAADAVFTDQQTHGIEVRGSSDLTFDRVRFHRVNGDGIRLVGKYREEDDRVTERVLVTNSRFEFTGRGGVGIQRASRFIQIIDNYFEGVEDQSISAEPGGRTLGDAAPRDLVIEGNVIRHTSRAWAVAIEGVSIGDLAQRIVFRNNRVENGSVAFRRVDTLVIKGNVIIGDDRHPALSLPTRVSNVQVVGNNITGNWSASGVIQVTASYDQENAFPQDVTIRNNRITAAAGFSAIFVRDALGDVAIVGNKIYGDGGLNGVQFLNQAVLGTRRMGFTVSANEVRNFTNAVHFGTKSDPYGNITLVENVIDHNQAVPTVTVGVLFNKTDPIQKIATLNDNLFGDGITTPILYKSP